MSEQQVLQELLRIYTVPQLEAILQQSKQVATEGYGTVAIIFHQAHPYRLEVMRSVSLSLKPRTAAIE